MTHVRTMLVAGALLSGCSFGVFDTEPRAGASAEAETVVAPTRWWGVRSPASRPPLPWSAGGRTIWGWYLALGQVRGTGAQEGGSEGSEHLLDGRQLPFEEAQQKVLDIVRKAMA